MLAADHLGAHIAAGGYSRPYLMAMAAATALYGFGGLLLAFDLVRHYVEEQWAFSGVGIWLASSLPVYMYFNPSWSHAHSAFGVSAFSVVLAPHAQIAQRTTMADIGFGCWPHDRYLLPERDSAPAPGNRGSWRVWRSPGRRRSPLGGLEYVLTKHAMFLASIVVTMVPTFVTRQIIYGHAFESGYPPVRTWHWGSPVLLRVLFSSDHGMVSWTPILIPSILGLIVLYRRDRLFGGGLLLVLLPYYYFIASYPDWDGISSFGNRFFVSLTPVFVIGLAAALDWLAGRWKNPARYLAAASVAVAMLVLWNFGLIFQWGTQLIPSRGPISWNTGTQSICRGARTNTRAASRLTLYIAAA